MDICVYSLIAYEMRVFPPAYFFINKPVIISSPNYISSYVVKEDGEILQFLCNHRTL